MLLLAMVYSDITIIEAQTCQDEAFVDEFGFSCSEWQDPTLICATAA
eukprot:SAG11_NODE_24715_length_369_cov_0.781481_1_plen_46_part_01